MGLQPSKKDRNPVDRSQNVVGSNPFPGGTASVPSHFFLLF